MENYQLTLKQYQDIKISEYKNTNYWTKALKMNKEIRDGLLKTKMDKHKMEWHDLILEYGKNNILDNKVIYSFDREYGRVHLLHSFRGGRKGLEGWINTDAISF